MTNFLLNLSAGLALISLAVIGMTIVLIIFMRWLQDNTPTNFEHLGQKRRT